jgi:hypothetical protein
MSSPSAVSVVKTISIIVYCVVTIYGIVVSIWFWRRRNFHPIKARNSGIVLLTVWSNSVISLITVLGYFGRSRCIVLALLFTIFFAIFIIFTSIRIIIFFIKVEISQRTSKHASLVNNISKRERRILRLLRDLDSKVIQKVGLLTLCVMLYPLFAYADLNPTIAWMEESGQPQCQVAKDHWVYTESSLAILYACVLFATYRWIQKAKGATQDNFGIREEILSHIKGFCIFCVICIIDVIIHVILGFNDVTLIPLIVAFATANNFYQSCGSLIKKSYEKIEDDSKGKAAKVEIKFRRKAATMEERVALVRELIADNSGFDCLRRFLEAEFAVENAMFLRDLYFFKCDQEQADENSLNKAVRELYYNYCATSAPYGICISSPVRKAMMEPLIRAGLISGDRRKIGLLAAARIVANKPLDSTTSKFEFSSPEVHKDTPIELGNTQDLQTRMLTTAVEDDSSSHQVNDSVSTASKTTPSIDSDSPYLRTTKNQPPEDVPIIPLTRMEFEHLFDRAQDEVERILVKDSMLRFQLSELFAEYLLTRNEIMASVSAIKIEEPSGNNISSPMGKIPE